MKIYVGNFVYCKKIVNAVIAGFTWFRNHETESSSHTEIVVFKDGKWQCFSSTNRGKSNGTRWECPEIVFKHPERWSFYEKEVTEKFVDRLILRADSIIPAKYDWPGIFGFAIPFFNINDKKKWYCSEAVWFAIASCIKKVSPREIITWIIEIRFEKCSRKSLPFLKETS